jgi:hypothetical protein
LGPLGTSATNWPIVPASLDNYDDGEISGMIGRGKSKYSEKTCPSAALSTTSPTCCPDATTRLSYSPALRGLVSFVLRALHSERKSWQEETPCAAERFVGDGKYNISETVLSSGI